MVFVCITFLLLACHLHLFWVVLCFCKYWLFPFGNEASQRSTYWHRIDPYWEITRLQRCISFCGSPPQFALQRPFWIVFCNFNYLVVLLYEQLLVSCLPQIRILKYTSFWGCLHSGLLESQGQDFDPEKTRRRGQRLDEEGMTRLVGMGFPQRTDAKWWMLREEIHRFAGHCWPFNVETYPVCFPKCETKCMEDVLNSSWHGSFPNKCKLDDESPKQDG